jgi:hypothetical protein
MISFPSTDMCNVGSVYCDQQQCRDPCLVSPPHERTEAISPPPIFLRTNLPLCHTSDPRFCCQLTTGHDGSRGCCQAYRTASCPFLHASSSSSSMSFVWTYSLHLPTLVIIIILSTYKVNVAPNHLNTVKVALPKVGKAGTLVVVLSCGGFWPCWRASMSLIRPCG